MQRRTALAVTGAVALTLAAGSAAMAANLGILDRDNGVDVGDLSPVGSSSTVSTPITVEDTPSTDATVPDSVTTPSTEVTTPATVGSTTPNTFDDREGDDDRRDRGRDGPWDDDGHDDRRGPGRSDDSNRGPGGGDDNRGPGGGDD